MDFLDSDKNLLLQFKEIKQVDYEPLDESQLSRVYKTIDNDNKEIKKENDLLVQEQKNEYDNLAWYTKLFYYNNNYYKKLTLKSNTNIYKVSNVSEIFSETLEKGLYRISRSHGIFFINNLKGFDKFIVNGKSYDINEFDTIPTCTFSEILVRKTKNDDPISNASTITCDAYFLGKYIDFYGWCFYNKNNVKLMIFHGDLIGELVN